MNQNFLLLSALVLSLTGCAYDENIAQADISGVVRIPKEAITIALSDPDSVEDRIVEDMRALGPVYVGAYPSVREGDYPYLHPEMGPVIVAGQTGDTYPYGGTSVGRFDWACYEAVVCKVTTGRFTDYDDLIDFFANVVKDPIKDLNGEEITNGTEFQERCYDALYATSDHEVPFISGADGLDFTDQGDYLEAEVTIPHVTVVPGMSLWGWVDMPSKGFNFSTCDSTAGWYYSRYSENYYTGSSYTHLLNRPSTYIDDGDWVADDPPVINSADDDFVLELGFKYED